MKDFMQLEQFKYIFKLSYIIDENIKERDIIHAFSLSMMTQVDEINSDRIS